MGENENEIPVITDEDIMDMIADCEAIDDINEANKSKHKTWYFNVDSESMIEGRIRTFINRNEIQSAVYGLTPDGTWDGMIHLTTKQTPPRHIVPSATWNACLIEGNGIGDTGHPIMELRSLQDNTKKFNKRIVEEMDNTTWEFVWNNPPTGSSKIIETVARARQHERIKRIDYKYHIHIKGKTVNTSIRGSMQFYEHETDPTKEKYNGVDENIKRFFEETKWKKKHLGDMPPPQKRIKTET